MAILTASPHSHSVSFPEFRDFLLLLPRGISTGELYRYYQVRKFLGDDGHGLARVSMEGGSPTFYTVVPSNQPLQGMSH